MERPQQPLAVPRLVDMVCHFAFAIESFIVKLRLGKELVCRQWNVLKRMPVCIFIGSGGHRLKYFCADRQSCRCGGKGAGIRDGAPFASGTPLAVDGQRSLFFTPTI
jgi:hypothetical protein